MRNRNGPMTATTLSPSINLMSITHAAPHIATTSTIDDGAGLK